MKINRHHFLNVLVIFSLAYYVFIVFQFVTHPFAPGAQAALGIPFLFRWLSMLAGTFTIIVALFIMRRVRGNIIGPLLLLYGVGSAGWSLPVPDDFTLPSLVPGVVFNLYFYVIVLPAIIAMFYYFPTGRVYPPRLERWIPFGVLTIAVTDLLVVLGTSAAGQSRVPNPLYIQAFEPLAGIFNIIFPIFTLGAFFSIYLRYRSSDTRTRLQLKWLLWLMAVVVFSSFAVFAILPPGRMENLLGAQLAALLRTAVFILWQSFAAVAIGISMLRHNLWGIDVIIRKTVTYALVVALLLIVYFGSVILLQQIFANITGLQGNEFITVLSTLAIAALFVPLRNRIQNAIDKRFYRKKYDAQQVLTKFAETVRDETDLEKLTGELLNVVNETMQPKSASVWLKTQRERGPRE